MRVAGGGEVDTPTVNILAASSTTPDESVNPVPRAPPDAVPEVEPSTVETSTDDELGAEISMHSTEGSASDVDDDQLDSTGEQGEPTVDGVGLQANSVPEALGSDELIAEEVRAGPVKALTTKSAAIEPSFVSSLFPEAKQASSGNTENEHSPEGMRRDVDASELLDRQSNGDEIVTPDIEARLAPDAEFEQMAATHAGNGPASFEEDPTVSNEGAHIEEQSLVESISAAEESTVIPEKETELSSEGAHEALPHEEIIPQEEMGSEASSTLANIGNFEMASTDLAIEESSAIPDEDGSPIAPDTQLAEKIETTGNAEVPATLMGSPIRAAQDEPVNSDTDLGASSEVVTGDQLGMELDQNDSPVIGSSQNDLTLADTIEDEPVDSEEPVAQTEEAASVGFADVTVESTHGEIPTDAGEDVQLLARGTSAEEPIESPIVQEEHSAHEQSVNQTPENFEASSVEPDSSPFSPFVVQTVEDQTDSALSAGETSSNTFSPQSVTNEEQPIQQPVSEQESQVHDENVEISPAVEDKTVKGADSNILLADEASPGEEGTPEIAHDTQTAEAAAVETTRTPETLEGSSKDQPTETTAAASEPVAVLHNSMEVVAKMAPEDASNLSVDDTEIERPKSPWTTSYSVINQGPDMTVEEDRSQIEEVSLSDVSDVPSGTEVSMPVIKVVQDQSEPSAAKVSRDFLCD
ncbi:hypothetical protein F5050DRAFT_1107286 [Lentinula boryana]|uniref:Uncharacterized protein n=1 Tax=Lentinula boryana TaxID=40481 RepID=A0ABQ8QK68_9AGAR|nr:hypothetical protein F5050DRAFT_1107286 [Lentinula boryana]